jgi:hypothetical protein
MGLLFAVDEDGVAVGGDVHGDDLAAFHGGGVAFAFAGLGAALAIACSGFGAAFAITLAGARLLAIAFAGAGFLTVFHAGLLVATHVRGLPPSPSRAPGFLMPSPSPVPGFLTPPSPSRMPGFLVPPSRSAEGLPPSRLRRPSWRAFCRTFRTCRTRGLFDGFAFTDFRRDFFFLRTGGGEGITNEDAEREDEQRVEPGLAGGWVVIMRMRWRRVGWLRTHGANPAMAGGAKKVS